MVTPRTNSSTGVPQLRGPLGLLGVDSGTLPRLLVAVVLLAAPSYVAAQVGTNDVHVLSHTIHASPASTQQILRADVDLALVIVTLLEPPRCRRTGLRLTNCAVLYDKNPRVIRFLSNVDEPISLVVVL